MNGCGVQNRHPLWNENLQRLELCPHCGLRRAVMVGEVLWCGCKREVNDGKSTKSSQQ